MAIARWIGAAALVASTAGCSLVTDQDFDVRQPPTLCGNDPDAERQDLVLRLIGLGPVHERQRVVGTIVRRVQNDGGLATASRFVGAFDLAPLGADDQDVVMPCLLDRSTAIASSYEILLWANADADLTPSCRPVTGRPECTDHQWVVPIPDDGVTTFEHTPAFDDVREGRTLVPRPRVVNPGDALPIVVQFRGMDAFVGRTMVARVRAFEDGPGEPVILHHRRVIGDRDVAPETSFELRSDFAVLNDETVVAELWIDTNGNGTYDPPDPTNPSRDYATSVDISADADGAIVLFDGTALPPAQPISL